MPWYGGDVQEAINVFFGLSGVAGSRRPTEGQLPGTQHRDEA
jgi:hypothetical protein